MNIYKDNELMLDSSIVTIGAFDGLHLGHQSLLKQTVECAKQKGVPSVVYTFDPPPRALFQGVKVLTSVKEKVELLKNYDIDHVIIANFNKMYASKLPLQFIIELKKFNPQKIIVGPNFTFGKNKHGTIDLLSHHFPVQIQPLIRSGEGEVISSTRIRGLIEESETEQVENLLGRRNLEILNI